MPKAAEFFSSSIETRDTEENLRLVLSFVSKRIFTFGSKPGRTMSAVVEQVLAPELLVQLVDVAAEASNSPRFVPEFLVFVKTDGIMLDILFCQPGERRPFLRLRDALRVRSRLETRTAHSCTANRNRSTRATRPREAAPRAVASSFGVTFSRTKTSKLSFLRSTALYSRRPAVGAESVFKFSRRTRVAGRHEKSPCRGKGLPGPHPGGSASETDTVAPDAHR